LEVALSAAAAAAAADHCIKQHGQIGSAPRLMLGHIDSCLVLCVLPGLERCPRSLGDALGVLGGVQVYRLSACLRRRAELTVAA
jgi:hypothetical protein